MNGFLLQAMLGMLLLLCSLTTARADASAYFPALTTNEKEEYTKWVNDHSSSYPRHTFMPSAADQDEGAAIFWNIDGDKVYFATAVRAEGWVGFGISEAGDEGLALPNDVGFPTTTIYNNPDNIEGKKDSSGMRLYYVEEERTHQAGILQVGDPWLALNTQSIAEGLTEYTFSCPGSCSSSILAKERSRENQGVTIIAEFLHMHQTGVRMTNEVIRDSEVFHEAAVEVYDFEQQGGFHVPQVAYDVLPGDGFRTTCYYKDGGKFGYASDEEMCIAFLMYYPAKEFSFGMPWVCPMSEGDLGVGCAQELEHTTLNSVDDLKRSFGTSSGQCASKPSGGIFSTNDAPPVISAPKEEITITLPKEEPDAFPAPEEELTSGTGLDKESFFLSYAIVLLACFLM